MCDNDFDDILPALKFVRDWFVTKTMMKNLHNALFQDNDILFLMKILVTSHSLMMKTVFLV